MPRNSHAPCGVVAGEGWCESTAATFRFDWRFRRRRREGESRSWGANGWERRSGGGSGGRNGTWTSSNSRSSAMPGTSYTPAQPHPPWVSAGGRVASRATFDCVPAACARTQDPRAHGDATHTATCMRRTGNRTQRTRTGLVGVEVVLRRAAQTQRVLLLLRRPDQRLSREGWRTPPLTTCQHHGKPTRAAPHIAARHMKMEMGIRSWNSWKWAPQADSGLPRGRALYLRHLEDLVEDVVVALAGPCAEHTRELSAGGRCTERALDMIDWTALWRFGNLVAASALWRGQAVSF